jgi:CubicO group peptidase (beta-lactamase class C family)
MPTERCASMKTLTLLLLLFLTSAPSWADTQGLSAESALAVDTTVKEFMRDNQVKGVGVGILTQGRISYVQGYGTINRHAPVDLASLSKPLTAVLALRLAEEGKLDLDAPITRYLRELSLPSGLTARTLLSHTSGLSHYNGRFPKSGFSAKDFGSDALATQPGDAYLYSSPGYALLSWALEAAGGEGFLDQINSRLCAPARATKLSLNADPRYGWRLGAGGLKGSPESMARIAYALLQRRILSRESYKDMWTAKIKIPDKDSSQALGFLVDEKGRVSHGGSHPKDHYYHRLVLYPERGHGMVILTHASSSSAKKKPGQLSTSLYKALKASGHKV